MHKLPGTTTQGESAMKKNRLSTSAKPLALENLTDSDAVQVNGGASAPLFGLPAPGGGHVFGVIINPNPPTPTKHHHHKKPKHPPVFGLPIHP
jgi:hypothetical protein